METEPAQLVYRSRSGAFEPLIDWRLTEDALVREVAGPAPSERRRAVVALLLRLFLPWLRTTLSDRWPSRVAYGDIASMRLRFDPTRVDRDRYRCDLAGPVGARASLFSSHYEGVGRFADRSSLYEAFIGELALRVQMANPGIRIAGGLSWPRYLLQHGLLLATTLAVVALVLALGLPATGPAWVKLAFIVGAAGTVWLYILRNRPRDLSLQQGDRERLEEWRSRARGTADASNPPD